MSKRTYPLNDTGYVTTWLVSGRLDTPVDPSTRTIVEQSVYEREQRRHIHDDNLKSVPENIELGAPGISEELPWYMYISGPNSYIDLSTAYFTIYRCEFWAATSIVSPYEQEIEADIWNYPSCDAWLNGKHISAHTTCHYSPVNRSRVTLSLKKGENLFFLRAQNACTRDTRNIVALSFPNNPDIAVAYPGKENPVLDIQRAAVDWVYSLTWNGEKIIAPTEAPGGVSFTVNDEAASGTVFEIGADKFTAKIRAEVNGFSVNRTIEINERILPPKKLEWASAEEAREAFLKSLADNKATVGTPPVCQFFFTTYARLCHGLPLEENDIQIVRACLNEVNLQKDCSDFRFGYILASIKKGFFPDYLVEEIREAALNFSYWSDEKAKGAMCYWSENHSLLFHNCQMLAGMLWPDDVFVCSGRTGKEQYEIASERIDKWLEKIENEGFYEFLSGTYTSWTVAAMLTVIDFAREDLSARCARLLDGIFYAIAHNSFDGIIYAPQGRVYREVIAPWRGGTQTLLYYATGNAVPNGIGNKGSLIATFAGSKYKFPTDLTDHVNKKGMHYTKVQGTRIQTFKGDHFMLTSLPLELSECFSKIRPGGLGYQQHLSYATLGGACFVYPQHPGLPYDAATVRPGYWFGNGYFPSQKQWDNLIGQVFPLDEEHPIRFTHLYFPTRCFDEWEQDGDWLFGRRGEGYVAVWCSNKLSLFDGDIVQGCDFRAECGAAAYFTALGDTVMCGTYDDFKRYAKSFAPSFDRETLTLTTAMGHKIGGEFGPHA